MIKISSDFDHGNIKCLDRSNPSDIRLEIEEDGKAKFFQWFFFCVEGAMARPLVMNISNAKEASYPRGWKDYRAVASYDHERWFRVETGYDGKSLTIKHTPDQDRVYYAYFAAYPAARCKALVEKTRHSSLIAHEYLGQTLDGQDIDYFRVGEPGDSKRNFWVNARQHPGETMASWWMEGFLARITDEADPAAKALREKAVVHIIPCMNLDGVKRGHLRTNAAGTDLNRAWRNASMELSPEVFLVRRKMQETGVDFFLDVHGDEAIPNNFIDSAKGIPSWDDRHEMLCDRYSALLLEASKDFQTKDGYPTAAPGAANLDIANSYVAETWNCLSMTLEMPFKDANVNPDPVYGWSPERCRSFGRDNLAVMAQMIDVVR